ncbi:hypothetical protein PYCCODRAFT_1428187 [Trametes coccinea BRFM310]|uniref:Uncharacterized protein n=1 Tax=Trametes coccinea (strain BRFM310) TaxID=1353009 RepID=A0A1Y2I9P8_TRAC3|nr:hypothetical protein PYCCODRAFT_1428187 [Trametes coccinea BRFM310]
MEGRRGAEASRRAFRGVEEDVKATGTVGVRKKRRCEEEKQEAEDVSRRQVATKNAKHRACHKTECGAESKAPEKRWLTQVSAHTLQLMQMVQVRKAPYSIIHTVNVTYSTTYLESNVLAIQCYDYSVALHSSGGRNGLVKGFLMWLLTKYL